MAAPAGRLVRLVLVTPGGTLAGQLPEFGVAVPWWQEAGAVVAGARAAFGIEVTLLRLLAVGRPEAGLMTPVTYLAECNSPPLGLPPWPGALQNDPRLCDYALHGGPGRALDWARAELTARGLSLSAPPEQVRSWNLSALWRLPLAQGAAWLKLVPGFFAHEAAVLALLADAPVPRLLASAPGRMLLAEVAGQDLYEAPRDLLAQMIPLLISIQRRFLARADDLVCLGLPDYRAPALIRAVEDVVAREAGGLDPEARASLARFVEGLPERMTEVAGCGLPDGLVHGDFHPGNLRGQGGALVLLDWADSGVGHPLLDQPAFLAAVAPDQRAGLAQLWAETWRQAVPGSAPERAAALLAPVAAARQAVVYRRFLDRIAPSEHPYHLGDPALWLGRTADLLRGSQGVNR